MSSEMWRVAADAFLAGRNSKGEYSKRAFGMYRIVDLRNSDGTPNGQEQLVYITSDQKVEVIAYRGTNGTFANSSVLPLLGRKFAWGTPLENRKESPVQQYLRSKGLAMIPMYQLASNGFEVQSITVADKGKEETVTVMGEEYYDYTKHERVRKPDEQRHFTGAMLLNTQDKEGKPFQFLFDIDRNEIKYKRFNAFFVQLNKPVKTIDAAYESLKPKMVKEALKKKLDVKRQGEWFFVPTKFNPEKNLKKKPLSFEDKLILEIYTGGSYTRTFFTEEEFETVKKRQNILRNRDIKEATLRAGNNRPNTVEMGVTIKEVTYVKGKVSHDGREHEDLILEGWHIAIPNTSIQSWQLDGKID